MYRKKEGAEKYITRNQLRKASENILFSYIGGRTGRFWWMCLEVNRRRRISLETSNHQCYLVFVTLGIGQDSPEKPNQQEIVYM
jgi:hypothetical protein